MRTEDRGKSMNTIAEFVKRIEMLPALCSVSFPCVRDLDFDLSGNMSRERKPCAWIKQILTCLTQKQRQEEKK